MQGYLRLNNRYIVKLGVKCPSSFFLVILNICYNKNNPINSKGAEIMSSKRHLRRIFNRIFAKWEIPEEVINTAETKILHISDTPRSIHKKIIDLVAIINPEIIIHTGDLVDDIKLEFNKWEINRYEKYANRFLEALNTTKAKTIYVIPGNHDTTDVLNKYKKIKIILPGSTIDIQGRRLSLGHINEELTSGGDYYLFGHNFDDSPYGKIQSSLNGVKYISVLLLPSEKIFSLEYPWYTNHDRKYLRFKKLL